MPMVAHAEEDLENIAKHDRIENNIIYILINETYFEKDVLLHEREKPKA